MSESNIFNQETINDKQISLLDRKVSYSFNFLKNKIDHSIKKHLGIMNYALERKQVMYDKYGSLSYLGKTLYMVESTNEPSNSSVNKNYITVITPSPLEDPSEQYQGYEFFMFRLINDKKSFNAELRFTFTFDEQGSESYEKSDVVGTFKYLNANGSIIKAYISEGDTSTAKPNPVAEDILEQEKKHLIDIIKNVFNTYNNQCNDLKSIDPVIREDLSTAICQSNYDHEDPDFFIKFVTCKEIFTLAYDNEFCPTEQFVHTDIIDDL